MEYIVVVIWIEVITGIRNRIGMELLSRNRKYEIGREMEIDIKIAVGNEIRI